MKLITVEVQHYKDLVVLLVVAHNIWLKNVSLYYQGVQRRGLFNSKTASQKPMGRRSRPDPRPSTDKPKDKADKNSKCDAISAAGDQGSTE